ncbi:MAG: esterase [Rhodothermales bacterium]|nr:esterase [Rhodothermales bacterium]
MESHSLAVTRTARFVTLGPTRGALQEVWFVLHGYGQRASVFARAFEPIRAPHRLIVAPEALSRFYLPGHQRVGASWMTKEDRENEITDYVAYLDAVRDHLLGGREGVRTVLLGFSQGGTTASRWAALGATAPDRLILWGGEIAHDLDLDAHRERLSRLGLTFVIGSDDEYITPERLVAQETRLIEHSIPYRLVPYAGGHQIETDVLHALAANVGPPAAPAAP